MPLVAAGGVLTFFGIVLFGPVLVPALVRVLGWPARRLFGATAGLAVANAVRNPRRIAATATALVIGIGLVSAFMVGARSIKTASSGPWTPQIGVDFLVTGIGGGLPPPRGRAGRPRRAGRGARAAQPGRGGSSSGPPTRRWSGAP